jgi:hypothetical protein
VCRCTARNFSPISEKFTGFGAFQGTISRNFPQLCRANRSYPARLVLGAILKPRERHKTDGGLTRKACDRSSTGGALAPRHRFAHDRAKRCVVHVDASVI